MATTTAGTPIAHYDDLTVREVLPLLELVTEEELEAVAAHERATKRRVSVLRRIQKLQTGENTEAPWDIEPHWAAVGDLVADVPSDRLPPPPPLPPPLPPPTAAPTTLPPPAAVTGEWAAPPPLHPLAPASEPHHSRGPRVLAVAIAVVAIAAMAALAVVAGQSTSSTPRSSSRLTSGPPPTTGATATTQAPAPAPAPAAATGPRTMAVWSGRNRADLVALQSTFLEISRAGSSSDVAGMGRACQRMESAVATVRADLPIPDPVANDHFAAGLDLYSQAAQLCVHGVRTMDASELLQAKDRILQATAQLEDALAASRGAGGAQTS